MFQDLPKLHLIIALNDFTLLSLIVAFHPRHVWSLCAALHLGLAFQRNLGCGKDPWRSGAETGEAAGAEESRKLLLFVVGRPQKFVFQK